MYRFERRSIYIEENKTKLAKTKQKHNKRIIRRRAAKEIPLSYRSVVGKETKTPLLLLKESDDFLCPTGFSIRVIAYVDGFPS